MGTRAENDYFLGEWARARELYSDAVATMHEQDPAGTTPQSVYPHMWLGILELAEGHDAEGVARLDVALGLAERYSLLKVLREIHGALAERDLLRGDAAAAYARLLPLLDRPDLEETSVTMWFLALVAWAGLALGRLDDAAGRVAECLRRTAPGRCRFARPDARRVEAMLAMERGRWDEAGAALEEGVAVARAMSYPYAELKALYAYGLLGRATGDAQAARARFAEALAICDRLGEGLYRPHIERALAACGAWDAD
jgi:tetratricopeptide (TPR) repeat protein